MANYVYPTNAELTKIAQDLLPRLQADRVVFDLMPITTSDNYLLEWEQRDNFQGLQQIRGIDGAPPKVQPVGGSRYIAQPGVYGEHTLVDENAVLLRRPYGSFGNAIDLSDLVLERQEFLLQRRLDRIELVSWGILQGTYSVAGANGAVMATDTYTTQTFTASVTWATPATSTPLNDFRQVQLKHRGHSVDFGSRAVAYANRKTINNLLNNTNNADIYGRRVTGLATANSLEGMNMIFLQDDLPTVKVYDEGYISDGNDGNTKGTFIPFIPDNVVIVVGKRPAGQPVGEYRMTRNMVNPDLAPGAYTRVIAEQEEIPPKIEIHDGHNGGPVIFYPSAIVVMSV